MTNDRLPATTYQRVYRNFPEPIVQIDPRDAGLVWQNEAAHALLKPFVSSTTSVIFTDLVHPRSKSTRLWLSELQRTPSLVQIGTSGSDDWDICIILPQLSETARESELLFVRLSKSANREGSISTFDVEQQRKLLIIGELAAGIMHDIRNPLAAILSYNNFILKKAIAENNILRMEKCQKGIEKAAIRIQRLSNHLREFSRGGTEETIQFNLADLTPTPRHAQLPSRVQAASTKNLETLLGSRA